MPKYTGHKLTDWLPMTSDEIISRKWDSIDVIIFSGDAYFDHPSSGAAIIGRIIEKEGFRVAIVSQPNWRDDLRDFKKLGKPGLFFGVTSGSMDSMVNRYTANLRLRSDDAYTPGGKSGFRPDYATVIYSNILKDLFPDIPVIIGGIEASMRRFTHYDYWSDSLKKSILVDSRADLLVYGMGERPVIEILGLLKKGFSFDKIKNVPQTAYLEEVICHSANEEMTNSIELYPHEACLKSKIKFVGNFKIIEEESSKTSPSVITQMVDNKKVIVNPPYQVMTEKEIDLCYDLPFTREPHPRYSGKGKIPAYEMIKHSINIHRGCFGGCSFCTISMHQGKFVSSRSEASIMNEVEKITNMPDFKGHITDIGGPTANMYKMHGIILSLCEKCKRPSCIFPEICKNLDISHDKLVKIYRKVRSHSKVKKATIGSGIRYDLFLGTDISGENRSINNEYASELIKHHVSGRLKVAPEHTSEKVLKIMRKPKFDYFLEFRKLFHDISSSGSPNQEIVPYFISGHPGSTNIEMAELAIISKNLRYKLTQIQDFTPTPMTLSTTMFYTGLDPFTLKKIFIPKSRSEKLSQRMYFFWYDKKYRRDIINDLKMHKRYDLIKQLLSGNR